MKITIELNGTLELAALESALEMFEAWADEALRAPSEYTERGESPARVKLRAQAGLNLLERVRGAK